MVNSIDDLKHTLQSILENQYQDNYFKDIVDNKRIDDAAIYRQVLGMSLEKLKSNDLLADHKKYKENS